MPLRKEVDLEKTAFGVFRDVCSGEPPYHTAEELLEGLKQVKPVRTPVAIFGSPWVCIYVPASRHWLISYSSIHLT